VDLQLQGKRALVTGSTAGIGAGIATVLAGEGVSVAVHGRHAERADAVVKGIRAGGGQAFATLGDLVNEDDAQRVGDDVIAKMGGVDILVNNVGGRTSTGHSEWFDVPYDEWVQTFEMNVGSIVRMCHRFVPAMIEQGWGRVINISSASGTAPIPGIPAYQSAKGAINNLTVGMSRSLPHTGVTVNTVAPGPIMTGHVAEWMQSVAEQQNWGTDPVTIEQRMTSEMLGLSVAKFGVPDNIAVVVAVLASPRSGFTTGANYRVDGGQIKAVN
jgi:3-oxoacyl-[acyl-carrier protein] reductase